MPLDDCARASGGRAGPGDPPAPAPARNASLCRLEGDAHCVSCSMSIARLLVYARTKASCSALRASAARAVRWRCALCAACFAPLLGVHAVLESCSEFENRLVAEPPATDPPTGVTCSKARRPASLSDAPRPRAAGSDMRRGRDEAGMPRLLPAVGVKLATPVTWGAAVASALAALAPTGSASMSVPYA